MRCHMYFGMAEADTKLATSVSRECIRYYKVEGFDCIVWAPEPILSTYSL